MHCRCIACTWLAHTVLFLSFFSLFFSLSFFLQIFLSLSLSHFLSLSLSVSLSLSLLLFKVDMTFEPIDRLYLIRKTTKTLSKICSKASVEKRLNRLGTCSLKLFIAKSYISAQGKKPTLRVEYTRAIICYGLNIS